MNEVIDKELSKLSLAERIQLVGDVWDAIARDSKNDVRLTVAQRDELEHRVALYEQNPAGGKSLDEILVKHDLTACVSELNLALLPRWKSTKRSNGTKNNREAWAPIW